VPGVELSTTEGDVEVHLLGYWIDPEHAPLRRELTRIREARIERARKIIDRLEKLDITLDFDEVMDLTENGLVGRPHVAEAMVRAGAAPDARTAFRLYLRDGKPAAIPKRFLSPAEGIRLIRGAGGVVSVAHPSVTKSEGMLPKLKIEGLAGMEVWHPKHTYREIERLTELANSIDLVPTGGSDYHGIESGATILGHYGLTQECYERFAAMAGEL
jgi:predicted metal-dependent phosphoesterase TrpH